MSQGRRMRPDRVERFLADEDESTPRGICWQCLWWAAGGLKPGSCRAFPDGVPKPFVSGEEQHRSPVEGDRGIVFEPRLWDGPSLLDADDLITVQKEAMLKIPLSIDTDEARDLYRLIQGAMEDLPPGHSMDMVS